MFLLVIKEILVPRVFKVLKVQLVPKEYRVLKVFKVLLVQLVILDQKDKKVK